MSGVSNEQAQKTALRMKWEEKYSSYSDAVLYSQIVLTWLKPVEFVILFVSVNIGLWIILSAAHNLPILTFLALGLFFYFVGTFIYTSYFYIPWAALLHPDYTPKNKSLHVKLYEFSEITQYAVECYYIIYNFYYTIQDFRKRQSLKFVIEVSVVLLAIAYLGTLFSLHFLIWFTIDILLLLPGIFANNILSRGYAILPPGVQHSIRQAEVQILAVLERFNLSPKVLFADSQVNRKKVD